MIDVGAIQIDWMIFSVDYFCRLYLQCCVSLDEKGEHERIKREQVQRHDPAQHPLHRLNEETKILQKKKEYGKKKNNLFILLIWPSVLYSSISTSTTHRARVVAFQKFNQTKHFGDNRANEGHHYCHLFVDDYSVYSVSKTYKLQIVTLL